LRENGSQACWNFGALLRVGFRGGALERASGGAAGDAGAMIRKLKSGRYRLYSRKINPKTGRRRNLGTFKTRAAAEKHERAVQYFKRH
jgi:hypothetical protein